MIRYGRCFITTEYIKLHCEKKQVLTVFIDSRALSGCNLMTKYLISKATEWVSEKDHDTERWRASSSPQESKADESQMTGCFRVSPTGGTPRKGSEHADCMDFSMLGLCQLVANSPR